jgi:hypothetical protein
MGAGIFFQITSESVSLHDHSWAVILLFKGDSE